MTLEEYEEWLKEPHDSWEIARKIYLFSEEISWAFREMDNEKWDKERIKKLQEYIRKLEKQKEAFEKIKWKRVP